MTPLPLKRVPLEQTIWLKEKAPNSINALKLQTLMYLTTPWMSPPSQLRKDVVIQWKGDWVTDTADLNDSDNREPTRTVKAKGNSAEWRQHNTRPNDLHWIKFDRYFWKYWKKNILIMYKVKTNENSLNYKKQLTGMDLCGLILYKHSHLVYMARTNLTKHILPSIQYTCDTKGII